MNDPREALDRAQSALRRGALRDAGEGFEAAAHGFASPSALMGAGHAWRGQAQVAIQVGALNQARIALERAAGLYQAGRLLLEGVEGDAYASMRADLYEGVATTRVMDADVLLRSGRFREARVRVEEAYPMYQEIGDRPSVADLWTVTARLSEREGRWFSARTAWSQALRARRTHHDEQGQCDALIRMAEAMLADADTRKASLELDKAEALARELEDTTLRGRVHIARARCLEVEQDWIGAWEKWQDALMDLREADPVVMGLAQVRMARTAAKTRPADALPLLEDGLHALLEGGYPDAIGVVLHQLAVVNLIRGHRSAATLAVVGAERARGGWDPALHPLLFRCLYGLGAKDAACLLAHRQGGTDGQDLPVDLLKGTVLPATLDISDGDAVEAAYWDSLASQLEEACRTHGLAFDEIGSRRMAMKLTGSFTPTAEPASPTALELVWVLLEGQPLRLPLSGVQLIGRGGANAVRMSWDALASRSHCVVESRPDGAWVRDLDSQHGTYLDDERLKEPRRLQPGQTLRVGETEFVVEAASKTGSVASIAIPQA